MLTKFILKINGGSYELRDDDLKNWADVICSYKRSDYGGVVRSFTSQFEFVNHAYDLLMKAYIGNRYNTKAIIEVLTMNSNWMYVKRFSCPLDFSTISWEGRILKINAVDNSLSAMIKANKGTKYEFVVGTDILPDKTLKFDRIPMLENLTYEFTKGESYDDSAGLRVELHPGENPWIGNVGSEISINQAINWNDDQTEDSDSYLFKALKNISVSFDYEMIWRSDYVSQYGVNIVLCVRRNGSDTYTPISNPNNSMGSSLIAAITNKARKQVPSDGGEFTNPGTLFSQYPNPTEGQWALVTGIVFYARSTDGGTTFHWENSLKTREEYFTETRSGKLKLNLQVDDEVYIKSIFSVTPPIQTVAEFRLLHSRLTFEWLTRGNKVEIPVIKPQTVATALLKRISGATTSAIISDFDKRLANTYIMAAESARGLDGAKFYSSFNEFADWMSAVFGYVYYIENSTDDNQNTVHFVHRSELLSGNADVRTIKNCRDVKYSVDSGSIYSSVTVGYDKKDYDGINGRDEFNFNNTYSTGCTVSEKKLSLLSKYRADGYGIEFAVQKRSEDTTDTDSDKDVFFVLCNGTADLTIDRSAKIENALSNYVFNGAFSPMACVKANAGFIGLQADELTLTFASSTGNSSIVINNVAMSDNIELDTPLATCGELEFITDEVNDITNINELIEVIDCGVTYTGFISDVDVKYARVEAAKYKLIVKEVSL